LVISIGRYKDMIPEELTEIVVGVEVAI
jgi:hypothetical protein